MNDAIEQTSLLIVSDDSVLVDALISSNKTGQQINARDSVQAAIDDPSLLDGNSIVIFDVGTNGNDLSAATQQAIKIKQVDPTQVLILVGEQELLADVLKSNAQPLVYRAFPKPVSANQVALAFKSGNALHADLAAREAAGEDISMVGPADNKTSVDSLAGSKSNNSVIFAALGVLALAVVGWLIFGGGEDEPVITADQEISTSLDLDDPVVTISATQERINQLNEEATLAMSEGRIIAPPGDNALEYFDQVLALDAYDTTAYEGKKAVAQRLRTSFNELVGNAEFDTALRVIETLQRIDPLNLSNDQLRESLQTSIDSHVKEIQASGTSEEIAETAAVLERIESKFEGSKSASEALKAEQEMVSRIDAALESNVLIPPAKNNAYGLVSEALKANSVSTANISPRVKALSGKLLAMAQTSLKNDQLDDVDKLGALIKRLNVNPNSLANLNKQVAARRAEIKAEEAKKLAAEGAAEQTKEVAGETTEPDTPKIIPAKIVKRDPPRYPPRALNREIEGWVEVKFKIDVKGEPFDIVVASAEPEGMFDSAAVRAVKKWRFSPARNETTGLAVESDELSTTLQFKLN